MSSAARLVVLVDREGTIIGSGGAADDAKRSDDTTGIEALPGQSIHVVTAPPELTAQMSAVDKHKLLSHYRVMAEGQPRLVKR